MGMTSVVMLTGAKINTMPGSRIPIPTQIFKQCGFIGIAIFTNDFPSLEPWHISTWLQHIVTVLTKNWHKFSSDRVVANFLHVDANSLNDSLIYLLSVGCFSGIYLVNTTIIGFTPSV